MKRKILFALCLLTGLMFINSGLDKLLHYIPAPKNLPEKMVRVSAAFEEIGWLLPLVGAVEIVGGLLLIVPKTRALGAIVIVPILTGILLTNITMAPAGLPVVFILIAIILWIIVENKNKYLQMISK